MTIKLENNPDRERILRFLSSNEGRRLKPVALERTLNEAAAAGINQTLANAIIHGLAVIAYGKEEVLISRTAQLNYLYDYLGDDDAEAYRTLK